MEPRSARAPDDGFGNFKLDNFKRLEFKRDKFKRNHFTKTAGLEPAF